MSRKKVTMPCPKNIDEFIQIGWDKHIILRIRTFVLNDTLNNVEDLQQDILLALMETHYIEHFDPSKGSFITYLYGFVDNFLRKRFNKENTRYGKFIVNRASLETSAACDFELDKTKVYLDMLVDTKQTSMSQVDYDFLINDIRKALLKKRSEEGYNQGKKGDALTVFEYLIKDMSVIEIAEKMGTSRQFIYWLCKRLRKIIAEAGILEKYEK